MMRKAFCVFLCVFLLLSLAPAAFAQEGQDAAPKATLSIRTAEDFLAFVENCRLDSYSQGLTVSLEADLDFTGLSFAPAPLFCGTFLGNGHTLSGICLAPEGSAQGIFRYLSATAVVQELHIQGQFHPTGSRSAVGALAGENNGQILRCRVSGSVSGAQQVGGLVGRNGITGIIEGCEAEGEISGAHFVGGIAGENSGVIRQCTNRAQINTTPQQNSVDISDITVDTLTGAEAANTVTDIGGIAGQNSGVIRSCQNLGAVGYRQMGYNIGGIAGTQSGYIVSCENRGSIQGRKEVGGIVGQMEPSSVMEYSQDTLQILQDQLGTMSGLVDRASGNAKAGAGKISGQVEALQEQTKAAQDAVLTLFPNPENPELPDPDTLLAAQNTLTATLNAMPATLQAIASAAGSTVTGLTRDLRAISAQINTIGATLNTASEALGGSITDISDEDTPELLTGKVESCANYGSVLGDWNVGGIAGAMAMENDLDTLEDWSFTGERSMNFQSRLRAVVLSSENTGPVTAKKQNAGGVVGWQSLGLIKGCANTGRIDAQAADYAGGIAGQSAGYIRSCCAKCRIDASAYAGGIAGSAHTVTDCLSMVSISTAKEKLGAVLGDTSQRSLSGEDTAVSGNLYPILSADPGGIDGISYQGAAQGMALEEFLSLPDLPAMFGRVAVCFVFEDGSESLISLAPGSSLAQSRIPALPQKPGYEAQWEGLSEADLSNILYDMTFHALYTPYRAAIQSGAVRENGLPLALAEGSFAGDCEISLEKLQADVPLKEKEQLLEAWAVTLPEGADTARFQLPAGQAGNIKLLLRCGDSPWRAAEYTREGSYLVFPAAPGQVQLALVRLPVNAFPWPAIGAAAGALALGAGLLIYKKRKKKPRPEQPEQEQPQ
ncbi:MAG: hypothetical protein IJN53_00980 [Oscillospiraceae bacterium]|nr:hypothetical protein [Oscillospiraceae bacterium]